jgi:hypothetical protein
LTRGQTLASPPAPLVSVPCRALVNISAEALPISRDGDCGALISLRDAFPVVYPPYMGLTSTAGVGRETMQYCDSPLSCVPFGSCEPNLVYAVLHCGGAERASLLRPGGGAAPRRAPGEKANGRRE